jgi:hypothetical protein
MPIVDLQPQLPTAFRLRLGATEKAVSQAGKEFAKPKHLGGQLRATSPIRSVVDSIQEAYNGEGVIEWQRDGSREWSTLLPARPLRVILVPGSSLSQWWEHWSGGTCDRRCDGVMDHLRGCPCTCPPPEERVDRQHHCIPKSRITLILPRMAMLCAGRLDTGSRIAAASLAGTMAASAMLLDSGVLLSATLKIGFRNKGRSHYVYPEIVIDGAADKTALAAAPRRTEIGPAEDVDIETGEIVGEEP